MELNPRGWGRVAQLALVVLVGIRVPSLVSGASPGVGVGGLLGATLGSIVVVGIIRHLFVKYGKTAPPDTDVA